MKIIFYRNAETGEIFNAHASDPSWDDEELRRRIDETNAKNPHMRVYAVEADENMQFLLKKSNERNAYNKKEINDILGLIQEIECAVSNLNLNKE